jgi:cyclopropane fatty-acyl-phospholipid synthase-like methyltransferase
VNAQDYWSIAEQDIEIQNPVTDRKLRLLDDYCDIRDGLKVLDIGCGKAWVMRQWADRYSIEGVGIDTNPAFLKVAQAKRPQRGRLDFFRGPATDFPAPKAAYDIVLCLGAAFTLGGFVQAVDWMTAAAKRGGAVVIGDLTLKHHPTINTRQVLPLDATELISIIERHGAEVSATISASDADFERYVSHHRHATLRWARQNLSHPDRTELLQKSRDDWMYYLKTIRPLLGWTIFVGRRTD